MRGSKSDRGIARECENERKGPRNGEREREEPKKSVRDRAIVGESERDRGISRERATEWWRDIARKSERVRVIDRSIGAGGPPSSRRSACPSP